VNMFIRVPRVLSCHQVSLVARRTGSEFGQPQCAECWCRHLDDFVARGEGGTSRQGGLAKCWDGKGRVK
jgi:hypothetical protein